jgi:hypothetical protein
VFRTKMTLVPLAGLNVLFFNKTPGEQSRSRFSSALSD